MSFADENDVPLLVSVSATDPVDPILPSLPEDEDENFTQEHQIFIAYLKHRVSEEEIADRFLEAFPDLVAGCGANAHGKLVAKWMAVERYVGMMMSRWAPVQSVEADVLGKYEWGRKLLSEFDRGWYREEVEEGLEGKS